MINLMKQYPYRTIAIALIVAGLAVTALFRANTARGALFFTLPAPYNTPQPATVVPPATTTQAIKIADATPIQSAQVQSKVVIHMSGKALRIVELKEQIATLQAELDLLEQN